MIPTLTYLQFWLLCLPAVVLAAFAEGLDLQGSGRLLVGAFLLLPVLGRVLSWSGARGARRLTPLAAAGLLVTSIGCLRHLALHGWDAQSAQLAAWSAGAIVSSWALARAGRDALRSRAMGPRAGEVGAALAAIALAWGLGRWEACAVHVALAVFALVALVPGALSRGAHDPAVAAEPGAAPRTGLVRPGLALLVAVDLFLIAHDYPRLAEWGLPVAGAFLVAALVQRSPARLEPVLLLVALGAFVLGVAWPATLLSPIRSAATGAGLGLVVRRWIPRLRTELAVGRPAWRSSASWGLAWGAGVLFGGVLYENLALADARVVLLLLVPWVTLWRSRRSARADAVHDPASAKPVELTG